EPALSFGAGPQALTAGSPFSPIAVQLAQAAPAALSVTVSSSSPAGLFSTSSAGPWSSSISLPVDAGGTATQSFFYEDTKAGSPMLTAAAPGYTSATQTETVAAASLSSIAISPSSLQLKVGS